MLQKLNERIQGLVAWIVIVLIALTFTLFGVDYYLQSHHLSASEVEVNGHPITKQAFEINYRRARQQRDSAQFTALQEQALKKQVLDDMIVNELSLQAAKNNAFAVSVEQANAAIVNIPQFQQDGHFSVERYQQALSGAMYTADSFQQEVKQGMVLNQQRFAFIGTAFALPQDAERFVKLYMQTRDYDYLQIPIRLFLKPTEIPEAAIKKYYYKNQHEFLAPEKVAIDYIQLSMEKIKKSIEVKGEDIKRYYEDNQANYLKPAKWQLQHILLAFPENASKEDEDKIQQKALEIHQELLKNPQQFSEKVHFLSDDKLALDSEGRLPWIVGGQSEFDKVLSTLTQPGQISVPIKTQRGYEIFKLVAYKPATTKPLNEVEGAIKEQLSVELAQAKYTQALEQLSDLSYQSPDSLTPAADALGLKINHTDLFSRKNLVNNLTKNKLLVNLAFSHDVLELGNNSEPLQIDNDSVIVLRVRQHKPAAQKSLEQVKNYIIKKLTFEEAKKQTAALGLQLAAQDQQAAQKLAESYQLQWQAIKASPRENDKLDAVINSLAFSVTKVDEHKGAHLANGNYVLVRLKQINNGDFSKLDREQQASLTQQIEASYGAMDYDLYIANLLHKAKIDR